MDCKTINPPRIYSDWAAVLLMLREKSDDEAVLQAMQRGTIEWQTGVAERFTRNLTDSVNFRINEAIDRFQRDMSKTRGHERVIIQSLLALRRELEFLSKAVNLPAIPADYRRQCYNLVISQANSIQKSLENSAKKDRSGKLASIVKNNRVNDF